MDNTPRLTLSIACRGPGFDGCKHGNNVHKHPRPPKYCDYLPYPHWESNPEPLITEPTSYVITDVAG